MATAKKLSNPLGWYKGQKVAILDADGKCVGTSQVWMMSTRTFYIENYGSCCLGATLRGGINLKTGKCGDHTVVPYTDQVVQEKPILLQKIKNTSFGELSVEALKQIVKIIVESESRGNE